MTEPSPAPITQPLPGIAPAQQSILNSAMLIVGPSGSGKSSLLITLAEYVYARWKMVTLYYLLDGGGIPAQGEELVKRGIIRLWRVRTRSAEGLTFETMQRVSQGWWPRRIKPTTGETEPNVDLVPPVTESYAMYCGVGHHMKTVPFQSMLVPSLCDQCKRVIGAGEWKIQPSVKRTKGFEQVGAMVIDGLTSGTNWLMEDLSRRLDLGGEKGALGPVVSGGMVFGSNNRAHYGQVQSRAEQMVLNGLGVPYLVVPPVWTALQEEAADDGGLRIKAPIIPGSAKSAQVTQWFGDTLGTRIEERDGKRYRQLRLAGWYEHPGAIRHLCGVRSFPGRLPAILEEEEAPLGRPDLAFKVFNLGHYLDLREEAGKAIAAEYAAKYADAPGVEAGIVEFGEAPTEILPQGLPQPGPGVAPAAVGPAASAPAPAAQAPGVRRRAGAPVAQGGPPTLPTGAPPVPGAPGPGATASIPSPSPAVATPPAGIPTTAAPPVAVLLQPPAAVSPGAPTPAPVTGLPAQVPSPAPVGAPVVTRPVAVPPPAAPVARPAPSPVVSGPAPQPQAPTAGPKKTIAPPPPGRRPV